MIAFIYNLMIAFIYNLMIAFIYNLRIAFIYNLMIAFYTFKKGPKPNLATRRKLFCDVLMIAFIYILMIAFIDVLMTAFKFGTQFFAFFSKTINFCTKTCCVILNQRLFAVRLVYSHVQIGGKKNFRPQNFSKSFSFKPV